MSTEKSKKAGHKPPQTEAMPVHEIENLICYLLFIIWILRYIIILFFFEFCRHIMYFIYGFIFP
jgi:hypothetical protein